MKAVPKVAVAWCPDCRIYDGLYVRPGISCPMDCDRKLIKRVGYICQGDIMPGYRWAVSRCQMLHWTVKSMRQCKHDAY